MKQSLTDWIQHTREPEQAADVLAQLLAFPRDTYGGFLNPSCFSLEFPEEEEQQTFGTLTADTQADSYDPSFTPVRTEGSDADDVFTAGLLLYKMLTGQMPDNRLAGLLLVKARDNNQVPFLHAPDSVLNPLLERMTDINPATRMTRQEALDWLADAFQGNAVMRILEQDTMVELERIDLPLTAGITTWKPPASLQYQDYQFSPADTAERKLPYRVKTMEYTCYVHAVQTPLPEALQICPEENTFGLDFGISGTRVSCLDSTGKLTELPVIPSVLAYQSQDKCVFGREALALHQDTNAGLVYCFRSCDEPEKPSAVIAADGTTVQVTWRSAAKAFMQYVYQMTTEQMHYHADASAVMTLPSCCPAGLRTLWQNAAQEAGWNVRLLAAPAASAIYQRLYTPSEGNLLVIDSGEGGTDVCLLQAKTGETAGHIPSFAQKWQSGIRASGGSDMTEAICQSILQTLDMQHNLHMYKQQDSGLNAAQFAENQYSVREEAERIKRTLSFSDKASCTLALHNGSMQRTAVKLIFTQSQCQMLLEPSMKSLRQTMQQVLTGAGITPAQVSAVLLTGGGSLTAALRQTVTSFFQGTGCRIQYLDYTMSAVRGAALYAGMLSLAGQEIAEITETSSDLGVITADLVQTLPVFQCLLPSGTPLQDGYAACQWEMEVNEHDLDQNQKCQLRFYMRPQGMEHVRSTLDPDGSKIRCIGVLSLTLPEQYVMQTDKLVFDIRLDAMEMLSVQVSHYRKGSQNKIVKTFRNLLKRSDEEWTPVQMSIPAEYQPLP